MTDTCEIGARVDAAPGLEDAASEVIRSYGITLSVCTARLRGRGMRIQARSKGQKGDGPARLCPQCGERFQPPPHRSLALCCSAICAQARERDLGSALRARKRAALKAVAVAVGETP